MVEAKIKELQREVRDERDAKLELIGKLLEAEKKIQMLEAERAHLTQVID